MALIRQQKEGNKPTLFERLYGKSDDAKYCIEQS